jgi:O-antigen/teichoic acid export membrane protein
MELRKFIQQAAGVGAVGLIDRGVAVGIGIVFARWLGPTDFGAYSFVIAAIGLLLLPARLGLPELLTRDIAASRGDSHAIPIRATILKGYLLVGATSLAIIAISYIVLVMLPNTALNQLMKVGLWLVLPSAIFEVTIGILRGFGRTLAFQIYATLLLSASILLFGASTLYFLDRYEAEVAINARAAAIIFVLLLALIHLWQVLRKSTSAVVGDGRGARELVSTGFGFMLNALIYMALMRADILLLGVLADERSVGLYRVAVEGGMLVAFAYGSATTVLAPEYARLYAAGNFARLQILTRQTARLIMLGGSIAAVILIAFPSQIIALVFGPEYVAASGALSVLAAGHLATFLFGDPVYLLNMTGHHNKITILVVIGLVISISLSFILIPIFGIVGAGVAASVALVSYRAMAFRIVYKTLGVNCGVFG